MKFYTYTNDPITYINWEEGSNSFDAVCALFERVIHKNIEDKKDEHEAFLSTSRFLNEIEGTPSENDYYGIEKLTFNKRKIDGRKTEDSKNCTTAIVAKSNLFGLDVTMGPEVDKFQLKLNFGRFQTSNSENTVFPASIDISKMNKEQRLSYFKKFYNMSNREALRFFGLKLPTKFDGTVCRFEGCYGYLFASCLLLDSLLKGKQSDVTRIICGKPSEGFYVELSDGTKIKSIINTDEHGKVTSFEGLSISKGEKEATVQFNPYNNQVEGEYFLRIPGCDRQTIGNDIDEIKKKYLHSRGNIIQDFTDIDCLDVSDVKYIGDPELIEVLKGAMQEQFESQREDEKSKNVVDAEDILAYMKKKKMSPEALFIALLKYQVRSGQLENSMRVVGKDFTGSTENDIGTITGGRQ
jgi:hypothetical protein